VNLAAITLILVQGGDNPAGEHSLLANGRRVEHGTRVLAEFEAQESLSTPGITRTPLLPKYPTADTGKTFGLKPQDAFQIIK